MMGCEPTCGTGATPVLARALAAVLIGVTLAACSAGSTDGPPVGLGVPDADFESRRQTDLQADREAAYLPPYPSYPLDDVLRLNQIQVKGTHNSYHQLPDEPVYADWLYEHAPLDVQLEEYGVRQVELDVHWDPDGERFHVFHVPILDDNSSCDTLVECLSILKGWSDAHPGHHTLFVLVEPKDDIDPAPIVGHYDDLDAEVLSVWPRDRLLVPDDVRGNHPSLEEAILTDGWPTLRQGRDKALFLMLDSSIHKDNYLAGNPTLSGRVLFVRGQPGEPWCTFLERGDPLASQEDIESLVSSGYMVRTAADDTAPEKREANPAMAEAALASGAHLISSDFPAAQEGYWFEFPAGNPSRCNPLTAPPECTSQDVEDL